MPNLGSAFLDAAQKEKLDLGRCPVCDADLQTLYRVFKPKVITVFVRPDGRMTIIGDHDIPIHICGEDMTEKDDNHVVNPDYADHIDQLNDKVSTDVIDLAEPEMFASADKKVICWAGVNYYKSCDAFVREFGDEKRSYCVKRTGHPSTIHEDFEGYTRDEAKGTEVDENTTLKVPDPSGRSRRFGRERALDMALQTAQPGDSATDIISKAEKFERYLINGAQEKEAT